MKGKRILVFDTETTGLPRDWKAKLTDTSNWPRVVQLGMILQEPNGRIQTWQELIKPENGVSFPIPSGASDVHGYTDEMCVERGVSLTEALDAFEFWMSGCDVLVAHNMSFDRPVVGCEFIRQNRKPVTNPTMQRICTKDATTIYCELPNQYSWGDKYKWPTLQELHMRLFDKGFDGAHEALTDCRATLRCFNELTERGTFSEFGIFLPFQR